jgi:hypothetical protein
MAWRQVRLAAALGEDGRDAWGGAGVGARAGCVPTNR